MGPRAARGAGRPDAARKGGRGRDRLRQRRSVLRPHPGPPRTRRGGAGRGGRRSRRQHAERRLSGPGPLVQIRRHGEGGRPRTGRRPRRRGRGGARLRRGPHPRRTDRLLPPRHRPVHRRALEARLRQAREGSRDDDRRRRSGRRRDDRPRTPARRGRKRPLPRRADPARQRRHPRRPLSPGPARAGARRGRRGGRVLPGHGGGAGSGTDSGSRRPGARSRRRRRSSPRTATRPGPCLGSGAGWCRSRPTWSPPRRSRPD